MAKRSVSKFSVADTAYIAALIDGEGSITLTRRHSNESRQLVVSISNNDLPLLRYVLDATGAGKITAKRSRSPLHARSYTYSIANRQALDLLRQVVIYLRTYKRDRAVLVLRKYVQLTPRNGRYSEEQLVRRKQFEKQFLSLTASSC